MSGGGTDHGPYDKLHPTWVSTQCLRDRDFEIGFTRPGNELWSKFMAKALATSNFANVEVRVRQCWAHLEGGEAAISTPLPHNALLACCCLRPWPCLAASPMRLCPWVGLVAFQYTTSFKKGTAKLTEVQKCSPEGPLQKKSS